MKSIKSKLYIFIITIIFAISSGAVVLSYMTNSRQIDNLYKNMTVANSRNFAAGLDGDYLKELRILLESDEYQAIHDQAEAEENEALVQEYLEEHGMWEKYDSIRSSLNQYINNMDDIKYLYIVAHGDENAEYDMFMIDDLNEALYDCAGRFEEREEVYLGHDLAFVDPNISYSPEWGWLVSAFAPVYDSNGEIVCIVGCDIDYSTIAKAKTDALSMDIFLVLIITVCVIAVALFIVNRSIIKPLKAISDGLKLFNPSGKDTVEANVLNLELNRQDEIGEIYNKIRANQIKVVDYFKYISDMQIDLSEKTAMISELHNVSYKDALTSVGNKAAYILKIKELGTKIKDYALVMIDVNNLKEMNDKYGHKAGDWYLQGCCHLVCKTFRHSPVFRIGGDEFVVVVENEDYLNRQLRYEELEKAFEISFNKETEKPWEKLSASIGMAENSSDDNTAELVFKRADKIMYENKLKFKEKYGSYR